MMGTPLTSLREKVRPHLCSDRRVFKSRAAGHPRSHKLSNRRLAIQPTFEKTIRKTGAAVGQVTMLAPQHESSEQCGKERR